MTKETTLKILPCKNFESLRILKADGSEVSIKDPVEANEFMKLWFNMTDKEIGVYWGCLK